MLNFRVDRESESAQDGGTPSTNCLLRKGHVASIGQAGPASVLVADPSSLLGRGDAATLAPHGPAYPGFAHSKLKIFMILFLKRGVI